MGNTVDSQSKAMYIYADNAATTCVSTAAVQAMMPCFTEIYGNPSSFHSVGQKAAEYLQTARETVAQLLHANAKEIYFTSGGSEADNQAIRSAALYGAKKGKRHIISTKFEHHFEWLKEVDSLALVNAWNTS